jgi:7-cyano-7-deazaguanine synthase in queuosine biosynthesis
MKPTARIYLKAPGEKGRVPAGKTAVIHLGEPGAAGHPLHHNLAQLFASPRRPGPEAASFLFLALAVWAADKLLPRHLAPDAWTRQIELELPASAPWLPLAPEVAPLLNFLTGDVWTLKLREFPPEPGWRGEWRETWQPQEVVLFSGGLDSLAGAIDRLEQGRQVLLVSHYDFGQLASLQQGLATALAAHYGPGAVRHLDLRVQFPEAPELTLRSRSVLYLALGLAAAAAFGPETPVVIPENGWVSLNPPLTLGRLGSYSTRTTHPDFLERLASLWRQTGLAHPLCNPYQGLSKGELLQGCLNPELLKTWGPRTVSCARPVVSRWQGRPMGACGYCYPCLLRRAALNRLGLDDGADYGLDVLVAEEMLRHRVKGRDLRALLLALKTWEATPAEMEARLWLGGTPAELPARHRQARTVLTAGFQEVAQFFREKGPEWLQAYLT